MYCAIKANVGIKLTKLGTILAPAFLHDGMGHVNQKSTEKSNQPNSEEAINPDQYTVIMPDDDTRKPCAICGERFIDFWNDDEEEWMYKNAVLIDGKVNIKPSI
jgi:pre-mRNA cleavage complex 2 protein Pcf11